MQRVLPLAFLLAPEDFFEQGIACMAGQPSLGLELAEGLV